MALEPAFAVTPRAAGVSVSTANTARDGTGTVATVITGASSGTRIQEVVVQATSTTTAGMVRLFLYDGSSYWFFDEVAVSAVTPSASVRAFRASVTYQSLVLPSNSWSLRASTHNAETFHVAALGADL